VGQSPPVEDSFDVLENRFTSTPAFSKILLDLWVESQNCDGRSRPESPAEWLRATRL